MLVETLSEFINVVLAFSYMKARPERPTRRVVLFGNGGGASVLGVDSFSRLDLRVPPFGSKTVEKLESLKLLPGTSITNPIDAPVGTMQQDDGHVAEKILDIVFSTADPDALVMHLSMPAFSGRAKDEVLDNLISAALRARSRYPGSCHFLLVLRSDGDPEIELRKRRFREHVLSLGVPVYDELEDAAKCLAAIGLNERFVHSRRAQEQGRY
jgi:acyl-CoA synthetase (NDP forming)